jgi:hypothetical protein
VVGKDWLEVCFFGAQVVGIGKDLLVGVMGRILFGRGFVELIDWETGRNWETEKVFGMFEIDSLACC